MNLGRGIIGALAGGTAGYAAGKVGEAKLTQDTNLRLMESVLSRNLEEFRSGLAQGRDDIQYKRDVERDKTNQSNRMAELDAKTKAEEGLMQKGADIRAGKEIVAYDKGGRPLTASEAKAASDSGEKLYAAPPTRDPRQKQVQAVIGQDGQVHVVDLEASAGKTLDFKAQTKDALTEAQKNAIADKYARGRAASPIGDGVDPEKYDYEYTKKMRELNGEGTPIIGEPPPEVAPAKPESDLQARYNKGEVIENPRVPGQYIKINPKDPKDPIIVSSPEAAQKPAENRRGGARETALKAKDSGTAFQNPNGQWMYWNPRADGGKGKFEPTPKQPPDDIANPNPSKGAGDWQKYGSLWRRRSGGKWETSETDPRK